MESVAVLDGVNRNHLVPPAVDVFQPEQQAVARLVEILSIRKESESLENPQLTARTAQLPFLSKLYLTLHEGFLKRTSPVLQRAAHPVPVLVHIFQFGLKLSRLCRVCLHKLVAAQVDGQDNRFALVIRLLQLLEAHKWNKCFSIQKIQQVIIVEIQITHG